MAGEEKKQKRFEYLKKLKEKFTPSVKYVMKFLFVVFVYGLMLCFVLAQLFKFHFSIRNIVALGLCAYFIKSELPSIVTSCLPQTPR